MGDYYVTEGVPYQDSDLSQANRVAAEGTAGVGQQVILYIDDDTEVLNSVRRLLIREGWVVLIASDPLTGLGLYEAHWPQIQLVLLDYFMPILRGDEVFERLQHINPRVRVLLTTSCNDDVAQKMLLGGLCGFVQKPISPQELVGSIRKSLNRQDPPPCSET